MVTVQIKSEINIDIEQLIEGVAQLETSELTRFLSVVSSILAGRNNTALPASETALIQKINQGLPAETQRRYDDLQAKLRDETLTSEEHKDLLQLVDIVEQASVERLKHLISLSQLRQVSVDEVMRQLEIQPPPVHV